MRKLIIGFAVLVGMMALPGWAIAKVVEFEVLRRRVAGVRRPRFRLRRNLRPVDGAGHRRHHRAVLGVLPLVGCVSGSAHGGKVVVMVPRGQVPW